MEALTITAYGVYLAISVALTVWVATTLHRHGRLFLIDTCNGNAELADSLNHLLVVGFYLVNIGYIALALKLAEHPADAVQAIEALSTKIGLVLVVLGCMHFGNLWVFNRMRGRARMRTAPPPVQPDRFVAV